MAECAMISLNARFSWTQKLAAIACCFGIFGKGAASWATFAPPLGSKLLAAGFHSSSPIALVAPTRVYFALPLPPSRPMAFVCPLPYGRGSCYSITSALCPSAHSAAKDPGQQQSPEEGFCHQGWRDGFGV